MQPSKLKVIIAAGALLVATLACGPTVSPTAPSSVPTAVAQSIPTAAPKSTPLPVVTATPPPLATAAPAPASGGLLFATSTDGITVDGLGLASADGTQVRQIVSGQQIVVPYDWDLGKVISPDGRDLAIITTSDYNALRNLTLNLVSLPDGAMKAVTRLTSAQTEPSATYLYEDQSFDLVRALTEVNSLAWSPDGTRLAFMGAMQGPTSDLYVYDLRDGSITQLTNGASQGIEPTWSPDGKYIVHAGVDTLGTGAGYSMVGVWAAAADGSDVKSLYTPDSSGEQWVTWTGPETLLLYSWSPAYGAYNLRTLDIASGEVSMLFDHPFDQVAADAASGTALVTVQHYTAESMPGGQTGAFLVSTDGSVQQVATADSYAPTWSAAAGDYYALVTDIGTYQVSTSGAAQPVPGPVWDLPDVSPGPAYWAWFSKDLTAGGLWVGPFGQQPTQVYQFPIAGTQWSPDSSRLFAFDSETLYVGTAPDFAMQTLQSGLHVGNWPTAWIGGQ